MILAYQKYILLISAIISSKLSVLQLISNARDTFRKMLVVFYTSIAILFAKILQNMPIQCLSAWKTPITTKYQGNLHSFCSHLFTDKNLFFISLSVALRLLVSYLYQYLSDICFFAPKYYTDYVFLWVRDNTTHGSPSRHPFNDTRKQEKTVNGCK